MQTVKNKELPSANKNLPMIVKPKEKQSIKKTKKLNKAK